ncbi:hypothetical protein [Gluconobacter albidus]|uniref:hypothetical protein n=1 Tax=Gluconobacter albidus TaxID=318683 RepID=UPI001E499E3E|nr:hypothetical protein [Gluconobacter albidus]
MSGRPTVKQWAGRAALWLVFPFIFALRPGLRTAQQGLRILQDVPVIQPVDQTTFEDQPLMSPQMAAIRKRTRTLGRLYGTLCVLASLWWVMILMWSGGAAFSASCVEALACAIVLGSQFVIQGFSNWQARTGRAGKLSEYLSDGRLLWPR